MNPGKPAATACRLCGGTRFETLLKACPTSLGETYDLVRCASCSFVSVAPLPDEEALARYYDQDYWRPRASESRGLMDRFYEWRMASTLEELRQSIPAGGRVLDWGAGDGAFVDLLAGAGFRAEGIDRYSASPNHPALLRADIRDSQLEVESYDAVTCLHVLEHLRDPAGDLAAVVKLLRPGGVLVAEVPNVASWGFVLFGRRWQPLEVPTHVNQFSPQTLHRLAREHGGLRPIWERHFSRRASAAALVLSALPQLTPKRVRSCRAGRYPAPLLLLYLGLQCAVLPLSLMAAAAGRGDIMRVVFRYEPDGLNLDQYER